MIYLRRLWLLYHSPRKLILRDEVDTRRHNRCVVPGQSPHDCLLYTRRNEAGDNVGREGKPAHARDGHNCVSTLTHNILPARPTAVATSATDSLTLQRDGEESMADSVAWPAVHDAGRPFDESHSNREISICESLFRAATETANINH